MKDQTVPHILYHYVTQDALLGILRERALFATKIRYFDDNNELIGPLKIALDILVRVERESPLDERQKEVVSVTRRAIENGRNINIPVASFTAQADSEHLWHEYADCGSGYAIGFDSGRLCPPTHPLVLRQCEYLNGNSQQEAIRSLIAAELDGSIPPGQASVLYFRLMEMAMTIKGAHFAAEDEWRLVPRSCDWKDLVQNYTYLTCQFRPGRQGVIPYWLLPVDLSAINEVIVGPSLDGELAVDGVKGLTYRFGLSEAVRIVKSNSRIS